MPSIQTREKSGNSKDLKDLTLEELGALVRGLGEKPFRARQIYAWLFQKGAGSIDDMTDVSKPLRKALRDAGFSVGSVRVARTFESKDGTIKFLFELNGGLRVESVLIAEGKRITLCVSTQAGCALGCRFCMTGKMGPARNLTLSELTAQAHAAMRHAGEKAGRKVTNVVLMGMGEPLLNCDEVMKFLRVLTDPSGMGFSERRVTVSTAGVVPGIMRLGKESGVNLAVSLNATTDAVRDTLMPVNRKYPLNELTAALRAYPLKSGRRITIEYVLIKGINDTDADARRLSGPLLRGFPSKINLIPFNPFPGCEFKRPDDAAIRRFRDRLASGGLMVSVRAGRGADIQAACGQLGAVVRRGRGGPAHG